MALCGIYKIQSAKKPERIYIGSSIDINRRWKRHLNDLKRQKHNSKKLQWHYRKYGLSDLQFSVISSCDKNDLVKMEQYFIDSYNPYFNNCKIVGSMLGYKWSDYSKKKLSETNKGNQHNLGNKLSDKTKKKISNALKGHFVSEESRRKMGLRRQGKAPWNKGTSGLVTAWNKKPVSQFSKDGIYIRDFESMHHVQNELGIYYANIWKCIKGKRKSAGGFLWEISSISDKKVA